MPVKKPIHTTTLSTRALARLFDVLTRRKLMSVGDIAMELGVTPQKVSAIKRHAKK
jgi:predicted ArsR family transcriptional regulator